MTNFITEIRDSLAIVVFRQGLFDEVNGSLTDKPSTDDCVAEFCGENLDAQTSIIFDVRLAGRLSVRTLPIVMALVRRVVNEKKQCAVVGDPEFLRVWKLNKGESLCSSFQDLVTAMEFVRG